MREDSKSFRVNIVDVFLTVILAAIIAVGAIMIGSAFGVDASDKEQMTVKYTIQFKGIEGDFCDNVKVGETVIDAQKRLNLGTVVGVKGSEKYAKDVYDEESGVMVRAEYPDRYTLYITVEAPGYLSEDGKYYVNGVNMAVGNGISIHMKNLCATGYVSYMEIK